MSPTALVSTLLRERGDTTEAELPVTLVFDHTQRLSLDEHVRGHLTIEVPMDGFIPVHETNLQRRLLHWNLDARVVGTGAFGVSADGETLVYRLATDVAALDAESLKTLLHDTLARVQHLTRALLEDPTAPDEAFAVEGPESSAREPANVTFIRA